MYNRYIPQPDGSFRRCRLPDKSRQETPPKTECAPPPKQEACPEASETCPPVPEACPPPCPPPKQDTCKARSGAQPRRQDKSGSIGGFFRQLLPRDLDTGDLMIILLLLLMAGDCQEDQNTALLTLALYLFM